MDRRNFLKKASLGAAGAAIPVVPAAIAAPQAETPAQVVYFISAYEGAELELVFTAKAGKATFGNAVAYGHDLEETAHVLARILKPNDPVAAKWVLETWLPKRLGFIPDPNVVFLNPR